MPDMTRKELIKNINNFKSYYPSRNGYQQRMIDFTNVVQQDLDSSKTYEDFLEENARKTYPILDRSVVGLIRNFLFFKTQQDKLQQKFYLEQYPELRNITSPERISRKTVQQFLTRLLSKRPLVFCTKDDYTKDRPDAKSKLTKDKLAKVNYSARQNPTTDYISYDEMQIASLLQVSSPSLFVNNGDRRNKGKHKYEDRDFIPQGIMVGLVGARFEDPPGAGHMEYQHMLVTPTQNTAENGYGSAATPEQKAHLAHWAKFYQLDYFPSYQEAKQIYESENPPQSGSKPKAEQSYIHIGDNYLNVAVYKARMRKVIESFLIEANARATAEKKAYVHAVGLGTGVWAQDATQQEKLILEVYAEVLKKRKFPHIADLDFAHFKVKEFNGEPVPKGMKRIFGPNNPNLAIHLSQNNPSGYNPLNKSPAKMKDRTLVVQYAWDGGSFPGNEYWADHLSSSGNPAAACASQIAELQNPLINPAFTRKCMITNSATLENLTDPVALHPSEMIPLESIVPKLIPVVRLERISPVPKIPERIIPPKLVLDAIVDFSPESKAKYSQVKSFKPNYENIGGIILTFDSLKEAQDFANNIPVTANKGSKKIPYSNGGSWELNFTAEQTYNLMRCMFEQGQSLAFRSKEAAQEFAAVIPVKKIDQPHLDKTPYQNKVTGQWNLSFTSEQRNKLCGSITKLDPVGVSPGPIDPLKAPTPIKTPKPPHTPSPNPESNWLLVSMGNMQRLQYNLENFRTSNGKPGHVGSSACSSTLIWSGTKDRSSNNVAVKLFGDSPFGFSLDPTKIIVPHAEFIAYGTHSIVPQEIKKADKKFLDSDLAGECPLDTKYENKLGRIGHHTGDEFFATNHAKWERPEGSDKGKKYGIYHDEGSAELFAQNVKRKFLKKGQGLGTGLNEALVLQKDQANPINGIVIRAELFTNITPAEKAQLIEILQHRSDLKMYIYDHRLPEHIVREVDNETAIKILEQATIDASTLPPFKGFAPATPQANPAPPLHNLGQQAREFMAKKKFLTKLKDKEITTQINLLAYSWRGEATHHRYEDQYDKYKQEFVHKYHSEINNQEKCKQIFNDVVRSQIIQAIALKDPKFATRYNQAFMLLELDRILTPTQYNVYSNIMLTFVEFFQTVNATNVETSTQLFMEILNKKLNSLIPKYNTSEIIQGFTKLLQQIKEESIPEPKPPRMTR